MMRGTQAIAAASTVFLATFLAAMPWGLPDVFRLLPPLLPFVVIYFWTLRSVELVPESLVFAAGIALDVLSGGPTGYWALVYLTGYALTLALSSAALHSHALTRWLFLGLTLAALSVVEVILAMLYFNAAADWTPPLIAALVAMLIYPLVAALLRAIAGPGATSPATGSAWSRPA